MAHVSTSVPVKASPFSGFFEGFFSCLVHIAEANARVAQIENLQRMTDEQLAAKGLKRSDIARHVFRDILYI